MMFRRLPIRLRFLGLLDALIRRPWLWLTRSTFYPGWRLLCYCGPVPDNRGNLILSRRLCYNHGILDVKASWRSLTWLFTQMRDRENHPMFESTVTDDDFLPQVPTANDGKPLYTSTARFGVRR